MGGGMGGMGGGLSMLPQKEQERDYDCPQAANEWCIDDVVDELLECQESIFVNLADNREQFTAYEGTPVWTAIYAENCDCMMSLEALKKEAEETCSERTLLYQMMSGLHTSISTHIASNFEISG
jgi:ERO1-like protein alpha